MFTDFEDQGSAETMPTGIDGRRNISPAREIVIAYETELYGYACFIE